MYTGILSLCLSISIQRKVRISLLSFDRLTICSCNMQAKLYSLSKSSRGDNLRVDL